MYMYVCINMCIYGLWGWAAHVENFLRCPKKKMFEPYNEHSTYTILISVHLKCMSMQNKEFCVSFIHASSGHKLNSISKT